MVGAGQHRRGYDRRRSILFADIESIKIDGNLIAADRVRLLRHRVCLSDVDLFRDFDRVIDFDAEIPNGAIFECPNKSCTALRLPVRR